MRVADGEKLRTQLVAQMKEAVTRADKDHSGALSKKEIASLPAHLRDSVELYKKAGFGVWDPKPKAGDVKIKDLMFAFDRHSGREVGQTLTRDTVKFVDPDLRQEAMDYLKYSGTGRDLSIGEVIGARRAMQAEAGKLADGVVSLYKTVNNMVGDYDDDADLRKKALKAFETSKLNEDPVEGLKAAYVLRLDGAPDFHEESSLYVLLDKNKKLIGMAFSDEEVLAVKYGNKPWKDLSDQD
jgi:hypothetical protein